MLLNRKKVKQVIKEHGKQVGKEYLERLDYKLMEMIRRSITNSRHFKRLTASDLL